MKKINIVKTNRDFDRIIKNNKPFVYKDFLLYLEKKEEEYYKFGLSVSKHTVNAVGRNKIKRQIRDIISKYKFKNNFNCIIIARKSVLNSDYNKMKEELDYCFKSLDILKGENL